MKKKKLQYKCYVQESISQMWNDLWPTFNEEKRIRKLEYLGLDGAGPWSSLPGQRNGMREGMVVQINIEMGKEN